jgi:hypothetical protein
MHGNPMAAGAFLASLAVTFSVSAAAMATPSPSPRDAQDFESVEVARIRHHLEAVEARLRANPPRDLTAAQRRARAIQLDRLAAYRRAGTFPHNHDVAEQRTPYFVDAHGTRCAMAHLIEVSGEGDAVALIASVANNATVIELGSMPGIGEALGAWLEAAGLTIEEAQAIQPRYSYYQPSSRVSPDHALTASIVVMACAVTTSLNLIGPKSPMERAATPVVGVIAGLAAIGLASAHLDDRGESKTLGAVEATIGGASLLSALARSRHRRGDFRSSAAPEGAGEFSPTLSLVMPPGRLLALRVAF